MAAAPSRLLESFLRGLEADLRALCADARRRSPHVKEVAEKVILSLKQADTPELEAKAADEAAAAFCVACELPSSSSGSAQASQIKVVLRAITSLHKLLTHRAVSTETLPDILDALQRLANTCVDDTVTLKVLQGLLSLLTVRTYAKSLSEDQLARAFSLLFILKTSRSAANSNPATNALSAISQQMAPSTDSGVIEQTSKAAFRQVSSDLFAVAADAAVQTAVRMKVPSGEHIPLDEFPSEARAAHSLLMDLCHAASGDPLLWLSNPKTGQANPSSFAVLDLALALEVIDDGLASNIALFAAQPVFSKVLSESLCPAIQKLLKTPSDKQTSKSLYGLVVTVLRNYWRILQADAVALLKAVQASCDPALMAESDQRAWSVVYGMEALRNIFTSKPNEPNIIVDFVKAFDLNNNAGKSIAGVVDVASMAMISASQNEIKGLPSAPVTGAMKPFGKSMTNTATFLAASATGLYVEIVEAMSGAVQGDQIDAAKEILSAPSTDRVISFIGKLLAANAFTDTTTPSPRPSDVKKAGPTECLARALCSLTIAGELCHMPRIREKSLATLAGACVSAANSSPPTTAASKLARRIYVLYNALFVVVSRGRHSLGPSWPPVVEALEKLDTLIIKEEMMVDRQTNKDADSLVSLKTKLKSVFVETKPFKWDACHEMISALVQSSRQSMIAVSKRVNNEDVSKTDIDPDVRIFGIASAESAILSALKASTASSEVMPTSLWQLLTGHLTSVCSDSPVLSLRLFGLNSLTRIACGAVTTTEPPVVGHDKIVTPFLDLFNSSHPDVRSGSLSALHTLLESQGEHLRGEAAWRVVLDVLTTAAGPKQGRKSRDMSRETSSSPLVAKSPNQAAARPEMDMVSEGFKVVQVIADDFLPSLAKSSLPTWVRVLGLYCEQHDDVNVALTSIGLLWRTADFISKSSEDITEHGVWVEVFKILKEVSMDERPEIRNCAVKTLTGALSAHSLRLTAKAWSECAKKALLPLLEEVMQGGSMTAQPDEHVSSRNRGDVQVMLHHSRDTPRKQWNETKVLALDGVAKVLRSAMPRLAALKDSNGRPLFLMLTDGGANGLWRKMLRAAGVAAASRDGEVAIAGVSAILELLSAAGFVVEDAKHSAPPAPESGEPARAVSNRSGALNQSTSKSWMSEVMSVMDKQGSDSTPGVLIENRSPPRVDSTILLWEDVWTALAEAVGGTQLIAPQSETDSVKRPESKIVDERALQILAEGLIDARRKLRKKFTVESSKQLIKVLMYLALGGGTESSREGAEGKPLTSIQESVLKGFNELSFGEDIGSWNAFIQGLLGVLPTHATRGHKNPLLSRRVLEALSTLYASDEMPAAVKRGQLLVALPVLRKLMVPGRVGTRLDSSSRRGPRISTDMVEPKSDSDAPMWALATQVVLEMMSLGWSSGSGRHADAEWILFADIATEFLYEERRTHLDRDFRRGERGIPGQEVFDMKIVSCVTDGLKDMDSSTSIETQRKLLRLISRGAEEGEFSGRRRFVRTCQKKLFLLGEANEPEVSDGSKVGGIASECGHYVVETCARVLGQYVADVQRAGRCPLPAGRRAEAVFLLQQLRRMLRRSELGGRSPASRKHVLALYPRLCECVESRDEAIRNLARELLDETSPLVSDGSVDVEAAMRRRRALA